MNNLNTTNSTDNEAGRIYFAIFGRQIPPSILDHFLTLSHKINARFSDADITTYNCYIKKVSDLEALELAARHLKKLPILTVKLRTMLYLAETVPENFTSYINDHDDLYGSILTLFSAVIRSIYKLIKGLILLIAYKQ